VNDRLFAVDEPPRDCDDWTTPPDLFAILNVEFSFTLDVAAAKHNRRAPAWFDEQTDGLAQDWSGSVWCNPPYSDISPWVFKAWAEWMAGRCSSIVMLLPANRTDQQWWDELVERRRDRPGSPLSTRFLRGRVRFLMPGARRGQPGNSPTFGSVLLIWQT
jgi:phage N-6-adenine-methyltransferase